MMTLDKAIERTALFIAFVIPWLSLFVLRGLGGAIYIAICLFIGLQLYAHKSHLTSYVGRLLTLRQWGLAAIFFLLPALSLLVSPAPAKAAVFYVKTAAPALGLVLFWLTSRNQSQARMAAALVCGFILAGVLMLVQFIFQFSFVELVREQALPLVSSLQSLTAMVPALVPAPAVVTAVGEPAQLLPEKIQLSYWLLQLNRGSIVIALLYFPVFMFLGQMKNPRLSSALMRLAVTLIAAVSVFGSDSNTAQMALLAGMAVYLLFAALPMRLLTNLIMLGLALFISLFPLVFPLFEQLLGYIAPLWDPTSSIARLEIWRAVNHHIWLAPVFGHGLEAARFIDFGYLPENVVMAKHMVILHPHSAVLQIWLEFGVVGAALALVALLNMWKCFSRSDAEHQRILSALTVAAFMILLTGYDMWQPWLFSAITLAFFYARPQAPASARQLP